MSFSAEVRREGEAAVIDMNGDIDRLADGVLEGALTEAGNARRIALNFTEVGYINSTGIALIVGLIRSAGADGRQLAAFGLSPHYREIFEITRLSDFVEIAEDEATAKQGG